MKTILFILLSLSVFAADKYYAKVNFASGLVTGSWAVDETLPVRESTDKTKVFEITQAEYESGNIDPAKIASALALVKDINAISKLEKCGFLVIMDYFRSLGLVKTNGQFKTDVENKYDGL